MVAVVINQTVWCKVALEQPVEESFEENGTVLPGCNKNLVISLTSPPSSKITNYTFIRSTTLNGYTCAISFYSPKKNWPAGHKCDEIMRNRRKQPRNLLQRWHALLHTFNGYVWSCIRIKNSKKIFPPCGGEITNLNRSVHSSVSVTLSQKYRLKRKEIVSSQNQTSYKNKEIHKRISE